MKITLPDETGTLSEYSLMGEPIPHVRLANDPPRIVYAAAHVVADPFTANEPTGSAALDWGATLRFRHHLHGHGLGIAEAMDTAQRGMGLDWACALELVRRTREELPDARIVNGCGTDHLAAQDACKLDDVLHAYIMQLDAIQKLDARVILMASRALARVARGPEDYLRVYSAVLAECDHPVILHWLGEMFDPALAGYWGSERFEDALETVVEIIEANTAKVDGIKISLLDKDKEIALRNRLPKSVKMYTGDDFNYPELMEGDANGYSHALLGIFDPLAPAAAYAVSQLAKGDPAGFRATLDPTVALARQIFREPTQYYKTGVVFLAWLNGFQDHFVMLAGAQAMRPLPYFSNIFRMADTCGLLNDPGMASVRMKRLLSVYGVA